MRREQANEGRPQSAAAGWLKRLIVAACLLGIALPGGAFAAQERYDYDALGRLIRVIDEQGRVTEYVYDAAGNILRVVTGGTAAAPTVAAFSPASIRRAETKQFQLSGTGLTGARVASSDPGLDISGLQSSETRVTFNLSAAPAATLGPQTLSISNAAGATAIQITVHPLLPKLSMSPQPIAVPPTNAARNFFVSLSNADDIAHTVNLASANAAIAAVSPASITIPAGQTEVVVAVTGKAAGTTAINLTSPDLASASVPVFVTAEFSGITTSLAPLLGVLRTPSPPAPVSTTVTPIASAHLGVARGAFIDSVDPDSYARGATTQLVVRGAELSGVTGITVTPPDGLTLGALAVAPDGKSVSVQLTVAADAALGTRRVRLVGPQQYFAARDGADYILITPPAPIVESVEPNFALAGTIGMTLTIRGRNLQFARSVSLTPATGITISSTPSIEADGTALRLAISVSSIAPSGQKVVTVTTPAGTSDATASPANTFNVGTEVQTSVFPIAAPVVQVVKEQLVTPQSQTLSTFASHLGVVVPPAVTAMSPTVGIIGQDITLTLTGVGLAGVTAVQAVPGDGLTVGPLTVAPDGTSVSVPVSVALTAPQTLRTIRVLAGSANIAFSNPNSALFRVTAPLPEITGLSQINLQVGAAPISLVVYGRNFQNASAVRVDPPGGLTISPPTLTSATEATVTISAAAGSATGPRTVIIATPAGESSLSQSPSNTLTLVNVIQSNFTPIASPAVGVVLESPPAPVSTTFGPFNAAALGVFVEPPPPPPTSTQFFAFGNALGVAVGPFATGVQVPPLTPNASVTLSISGMGLADATAVQISPSDNAAVGTLTIAPDGSQIQVPLSLTGAAAGPRTVVVLRGTQRVKFVPAGADIVRIAAGAPHIDSLSPILASRGQTFTMTIRGQFLQGVTAIAATPGSGISIDSQPVVNALGDIVLQVSIAADAPVGASVFRVFTPGGATSESAEPANTFTVLE